MRVIIGKTELTDYVQAGSFQLDSKQIYEQWKDGNGRNHRVVVRSQIVGSFNIICSQNTISKDDFFSLIRENTHDEALSIMAWVPNRNELIPMDAFYTITSVVHGNEGDVFKITLEEC